MILSDQRIELKYLAETLGILHERDEKKFCKMDSKALENGSKANA